MPAWFNTGLRVIVRARVPLVLLGLMALAALLGKLGIIPQPDELTNSISLLFERYGFIAIAIVSFLENLVGLNVYFPGSVAILTAMALSAGDPGRAILTFLAIVIPSFVAHQVNFFIGRTASHRPADDRTISYLSRDNSKLRRLFGFFLTAWHPHSAALASIYAGSDGWQYLEFVRLFSPPFIFWNLFWGILMYNLGSAIEGSQNLFPVFLLLVIAWLLWEIAHGISKERGS